MAGAVAKPLLVVQAHPELVDEKWRKANPSMDIMYMGDTPVLINTEELYSEFETAYDKAAAGCKCWTKMILRSNDGVTAEIPAEQELV